MGFLLKQKKTRMIKLLKHRGKCFQFSNTQHYHPHLPYILSLCLLLCLSVPKHPDGWNMWHTAQSFKYWEWNIHFVELYWFQICCLTLRFEISVSFFKLKGVYIFLSVKWRGKNRNGNHSQQRVMLNYHAIHVERNLTLEINSLVTLKKLDTLSDWKKLLLPKLLLKHRKLRKNIKRANDVSLFYVVTKPGYTNKLLYC